MTMLPMGASPRFQIRFRTELQTGYKRMPIIGRLRYIKNIEVDQLFSQVPLPSDFDSLSDLASSAEARNPPSRFSPVVSNSEVNVRPQAAVPANTRKNTNWALNVWHDWAAYRLKHNPSDAPGYLFFMG